MRHMSFALTTEQVRQQTKFVTRRLRWKHAKVGDIVQPVVKGQGIPKGEKVERLGPPVRFVDVRQEPLGDMIDRPEYGQVECEREGFPEMTPDGFVRMFCAHNGGSADTIVTRIEFEYVEPVRRLTL